MVTPEQSILNRRQTLLAEWPGGWDRMLRQWRADGPDAMWLTYSANYLLRAAGVRWMVDPVRLNNRVREAADVSMEPLSAASFVLLTHNHGDHVDGELLAQLAGIEHLKWVVPAHMAQVAEKAGVRGEAIIVPRMLEPIVLEGGKIRITPFEGLHLQYAGRWKEGKAAAGIDATGYLIEWDQKRLLLAGDTRTYDVTAIPSFGPVDTVLAHIWLGRGAALDDRPPLLDAFCDFFVALQPKERMILSHLWEQSRGVEDYWDQRHADLVKRELAKRLPPQVEIEIPQFWKEISL